MIRHPALYLALALLLAALFAGCPGPENGDNGEQPEEYPFEVRECVTRLVHDDGRSYSRISVAGTFNGWSETADRLEPEEGTTYAIELDLEPGEYSYKLVRDGDWIFDPHNIRTIFHGGQENSRLIVPDCLDPMLRVESFAVDGAQGSVEIEIVYVDGAEKRGPDVSSLVARLNRQEMTSGIAFAEDDGAISISLTGLSQGKYAIELAISDADGRGTEPLFLPFWVEEEPFDWRKGSMYFAFVDRFRNGDPSLDDPVPASPWLSNYQGGDFIGLRHAIEEGWFEDLGVTTIWITAPQQNPDGRWPGDGDTTHTGYHGYWPSSPRDTQPRFGTMDDLRDMIAAAHARGIRVLADVVLNHVHEGHPHWQEKAGDGWFIGDGGCVCGRTCDWEAQAIECWFTPYLPVYDWRNPDVLREVMEDVMWWVRETNLDGFRVDAVKHFERVALRNLRAALGEIEEQAPIDYLLIGETFTGDGGHGDIAAYVAHDQLHGQFDFPLYWPLARVLARYEGNFHDLDAAVRTSDTAYPAGAIMGPFIGNHDVPRYYSHAAGDIYDVWGNGAKEQGWNNPPGAHDWDQPYDRLYLGFAFILTQPGVPLIYYGDEVGLPGAGDPDNRRFMPWGDEISLRGEHLLERVRHLGRTRVEVEALQKGDRSTLHVADDVYVYARDAGGGKLAVVGLNRSGSSRSVEVTLPGNLASVPRLTFEHRLQGGTVVAEGGKLRLSIPAMSAVIVTPVE